MKKKNKKTYHNENIEETKVTSYIIGKIKGKESYPDEIAHKVIPLERHNIPYVCVCMCVCYN